MIKHGTLTGYCSQGCRCDECRAAMTFRSKWLRVDRARHGPLLVDKAPLLKVLTYALRCGFKYSAIAAEARVDASYLENIRSVKYVKAHRSKRDAILDALDRMSCEREDALADLRSAIAYAKQKKAAA